MAKVTNKDRHGNVLSLEQMLRKFKKQVEREETITELRRREAFVSKSEQRRIKSEKYQRTLRKLENKNLDNSKY